MISVTFEGFNTVEQAKAFLDWYEGQGEQDADMWDYCGADHQAPMADMNALREAQTRWTETNIVVPM